MLKYVFICCLLCVIAEEAISRSKIFALQKKENKKTQEMFDADMFLF